MRSFLATPEKVATRATNVVIVVGEKLLEPGGTTSENMRARVESAKALLIKESTNNNRGNTEAEDTATKTMHHLILSGGGTGGTGNAVTEAKEMERVFLEGHDNLRDVIIDLEEESMSTVENAFYSLPIIYKILSGRGVSISTLQRVTLVTSDYHVPRAKLLFQQVFRSLQQQETQPRPTIEITVHPSPTKSSNRNELFKNEREWLKPEPLARLLSNMTDQTFLQPSSDQIEDALEHLNVLEKATPYTGGGL